MNQQLNYSLSILAKQCFFLLVGCVFWGSFFSVALCQSQPLGLVLKIEGSVSIMEGATKSELKSGAKIFKDDIIAVGGNSQMTFFDFQKKGIYKYTPGAYRFNSEFSSTEQLTQKEKELLAEQKSTLSTASNSSRGSSSNPSATSNPVSILPSGYEFSAQCDSLKNPSWLNPCLQQFVTGFVTAADKLELDGQVIPGCSIYAQLPAQIKNKSQRPWIVAQKNQCQQVTSETIQIDQSQTEIYLVGNLPDGQIKLYHLIQASGIFTKGLAEEIGLLQEIWNDPNDRNYLWALYQVYQAFQMNYQAALILGKIEAQL